MDFELEYVRGRAIEEREAAQAATCLEARQAHLRLANVFEAHARKLKFPVVAQEHKSTR